MQKTLEQEIEEILKETINEDGVDIKVNVIDTQTLKTKSGSG